MDSKTNVPSFTVSLRGYDRVEVDEYLDSLADALGQVEDAQEQNRRLQAHMTRLGNRIKELEERISADTPKTGAILGERIAILLRSAEEAATETVERAESRAAQLLAEAEQRMAEADDAARVAVAGGQEQARRIEASARAEAAEIISEAESRAAARTRQIEQWAEQVVSHTRAEEARMLREQQAKREAAMAELRSLGEQRDAVAATLAELRETLGQALGLVVPPQPAVDPAGAEPAVTDRAGDPPAADGQELTEAAAGPAGDLHAGDLHADGADGLAPPAPDHRVADEATADAPDAAGSAEGAEEAEGVVTDLAVDGGPVSDGPVPELAVDGGGAGDEAADEEDGWWPGESAGRPPFDGEAADEPVTGQMQAIHPDDEAGSASDDPEFEAKLEAWVSEGAKHFRRM